MKFTNKYNLPKSICHAIKNTTYDLEPDNDILSATDLINPAKIVILSRRHSNEIEEDYSESAWRLLGQATHEVIRRASSHSTLTEERIFYDVTDDKIITIPAVDMYSKSVLRKEGGHIYIAGKPDLYEEENFSLEDHKVTSVWSFVLSKGVKKEWEEQCNIYCFLFRKLGFGVNKIVINAILRDWQQSKAQKDKKYPQSPIHSVSVPMWGYEEQKKFIMSRVENIVKMYKLPDDKIKVCDEDQRWTQPTTYAVTKEGRKSAIAVLHSKGEAEEYIGKSKLLSGKPNDYKIQTRKGSDRRCVGYCPVNKWCNYWKENYYGLTQEKMH